MKVIDQNWPGLGVQDLSEVLVRKFDGDDIEDLIQFQALLIEKLVEKKVFSLEELDSMLFNSNHGFLSVEVVED